MERTELFRALVGSHNYNLNTEQSDYDYKVFVAPTFDDLYGGNLYSKSIIGETMDLDVHDIRKTSSLWWKANVNFLEVLFSREIVFNEEISQDTKDLINKIFSMKNEIAKMNVPYLYRACMGMYHTKMKQIHKGTEGTKDLVERFGYDTKQALHVIRILDFIHRFAESEFEDFEYAINYEYGDSFRKMLLDVKSGFYTFEQFEEIAKDMYFDVENEYKNKYLNVEPNEKTKLQLIELVKQIVWNELKTQ